MLTKSDLNKIGVVVDQRLKKELDPIKQDMRELTKDMGGLTNGVELLTKDVKYLKRKVNRMHKTVDLIGRNYDEGDVKLAKRVTRIENHLALPE